jgi:ABC-2 type transport system ATP-binding protein
VDDTAGAAPEASGSPVIRVQGLVKRYGSVQAVGGIDFEVAKGEVVGLLGPNGAGKSTTIRILTGFLPATQGIATVAGHDVASESLAVRGKIGYLPEMVPLYPEMRVHEYLAYRAALKNVPRRERKARVAEVIERCWLGEMRRRLIGNLSKGYRQRVGLADALVGRPEILVLDEPTVGFDPNQVRQVRKLIQELGRDHTLLLSTHILREVEALCSRVIILNRGRIVRDASMAELSAEGARTQHIVVEAQQSPGELLPALKALDGVKSVKQIPHTRALAVVPEAGASDLRPQIFAAAKTHDWTLLELRREVETLEEIFARVTIGADHDEAAA